MILFIIFLLHTIHPPLSIVYNIRYALSPKHLETNILVAPICALEKAIQMLSVHFLPIFIYPHQRVVSITFWTLVSSTWKKHLCSTLSTSHPVSMLHPFVCSCFHIYCLSFITFTSSLHKCLLYIGVMPIRIPLSSPQY